jgi:hypothetical protein
MLACWLFFNFACCSLAQEMSFVDCYLPYFRQGLITCPLSALLPFQSLFTGDQLLAPPRLQCAQSTLAPLLHVPFQFLVYYSVFFFFCGAGVSLSRWLCWFIPGVAVGILCVAYLLTCCSAGEPAGLEPASGSVGALLFSQCNVCGEALNSWGFRVSEFWFFLVFFSAKCGSSISTKLLIYGAHAICFCTLVAILDPLPFSFRCP